MADRPEASGTDDKRRVLEATDLVRLIGEHVALKRKGREWVCLCPFHDDHNPSMYVVPHKQIYHCFVCGAGGDAISFVMNYHKAGFREALQLLADKAGLQLGPPVRRHAGSGAGAGSEEGPGAPAGLSREAILGANRAAQEYFRAILAHPEHGRAARELIERRGITPAMVEQFGLGAAAARWDGLFATASHKGLDLAAMQAAGLLKRRETGDGGGAYDAMRNRLIFPIHDALGRVIAFGGRRIDDQEEPKYLNSPETMLFSKSATLYGLPMAAGAIREAGVAIVTEGYMDCIACHQAGVTNVVATLGTALTAQGARVLRRLCETVVLLFDGDEAGQRAADRAIEVLFAEPIDVRIAVMTAAPPLTPGAGEAAPKDPDELLKQARGRERFGAMIAAAVDALEYRFGRLRARTSALGLAARARAMEEEIARLGELGLGRISPVRRHLIIRRVAALAGVPEGVVTEALSKHAVRAWPARGEPAAAAPVANSMRQLPARERLLACILCDSTLLDQLGPEERGAVLGSGGAAPVDAVGAAVSAAAGAGVSFELRDVTSRLESGEAVRLATLMSGWVDTETDEKPERLARMWLDCLARYRLEIAAAARPSDPIARLAMERDARQRHGDVRARMPARSG